MNLPTDVTAPLVGLVLAGGGSTRMGHDKASLELAGLTLLARAVQCLTRVLGEQVWVSGAARSGFRCVPDRVLARGPLAGIDAAMAAFPGSRIVVLPVDMPLVSPELITQLIAKSASAAAASFADHELPLIIHASPHAMTVVEQLVGPSPSSKAGSVHQLLKALDAHSLAVPEVLKGQFVNCNTPEEWNRLIHG